MEIKIKRKTAARINKCVQKERSIKASAGNTAELQFTSCQLEEMSAQKGKNSFGEFKKLLLRCRSDFPANKNLTNTDRSSEKSKK